MIGVCFFRANMKYIVKIITIALYNILVITSIPANLYALRPAAAINSQLTELSEALPISSFAGMDLPSPTAPNHIIINDDFVVHKEVKKVLIVVPFPYTDIPYNERNRRFIPLGAGYVCASLKRELGEENVKFLDLSVVPDDFDFKSYLQETNFDLIGFSMAADAVSSITYQLIAEARRELPESILLVGGLIPSRNPWSVFKNSEMRINIVVQGEGESIIPAVVNACKKGQSLIGVRGVAVLSCNGKYFVNKKAHLTNINDLLNPPWNFIDPNDYNLGTPYMPGECVNILSSRGCPYHCAYCSYKFVSGRLFRFRKRYNRKLWIEGLTV